MSAFSQPSPRRRYVAFACLQQRTTDFLRSWMTTRFAAATAFSKSSRSTEGLCHYSLVLDVVPLVLPVFLHGHLPLLGALTSAFCSPRCGPFFSSVTRSWKILPPLSRRALQDVPQTNFFVFWLGQVLQCLHVHLCISTSLQVGFFLLPPPPFFQASSTQLAALPACH